MIAFLDGELAEAWPTQVIVSVHGVGYVAQIPLSSFEHLPPVGQRVRLLTHLVVREDAHLLFGFLSSAERDLFRLLLQHVTGVGPKLALAVLSGLSVSQFKSAVVHHDIAALARQLQDEGANGFVASWKDLLGAIEKKSKALT